MKGGGGGNLDLASHLLPLSQGLVGGRKAPTSCLSPPTAFPLLNCFPTNNGTSSPLMVEMFLVEVVEMKEGVEEGDGGGGDEECEKI